MYSLSYTFDPLTQAQTGPPMDGFELFSGQEDVLQQYSCHVSLLQHGVPIGPRGQNSWSGVLAFLSVFPFKVCFPKYSTIYTFNNITSLPLSESEKKKC